VEWLEGIAKLELDNPNYQVPNPESHFPTERTRHKIDRPDPLHSTVSKLDPDATVRMCFTELVLLQIFNC
jgi:hypothetical protein